MDIRSLSVFRSSLHRKIFAVVFGACAVFGALFSTYFPRRHAEKASWDLERKATMYGELFGGQLESAVAFHDRQTAREVFHAAERDPEVEALTLFGADGRVLERRGPALPAPATTDRPTVERTNEWVRVSTPVRAREGARGVLVLSLSTEEFHRAQRRERGLAAIACFSALVVAFVVAFAFSRALTRRIGDLAAVATGVADGELDKELVRDTSQDEVGQLVRAFNAMVLRLKDVMRKNEQAAQEENARLDRLVAARTHALERRHQEMRLFLDHVGQGFLVVERTGAIGPERSAIVTEWFGDLSRTPTIELLAQRLDPKLAPWFDAGWEALFEDFLPFEAAADALPKRLCYGGRAFDLAYRPMGVVEGTLRSVLVVITDVTVEVEKEQAETLRHETLSSLQHALTDPSAFVDFMDEAETIFALLRCGTNLVEIQRALHTLKGTTALCGLASVSAHCHRLESRLLEQGCRPPADEVSELARRFATATSPIRSVLGALRNDKVVISHEEHRELLDAVHDGTSRFELSQRLRMLTLEPLARRLEHACEQASALARRQGKLLDVRLASNGVRFERHRWARFWSSFVHVIRNAVDHGIDSAEVRLANAKPPGGVLAFDGRVEDGAFVLRVSDDGNGVDWERLRRVAAARGLPCATQGQLEEALFSDGVSTRTDVTDISGRGVGLAAVKAETLRLGGRISLESRRGVGTTLRFVFPVHVLADVYATRTLSAA